MKPAQTLKHKNSITPKQFQDKVVPQGNTMKFNFTSKGSEFILSFSSHFKH